MRATPRLSPQKGGLLGLRRRAPANRVAGSPSHRSRDARPSRTGLWHTVGPGRLLRVVGVRRAGARAGPASRCLRGGGFTTALTLSGAAILAPYRARWTVAITLRDSPAFAGFGQDQCRPSERVVGATTVRLVLAAARTRWVGQPTRHARPRNRPR